MVTSFLIPRRSQVVNVSGDDFHKNLASLKRVK